MPTLRVIDLQAEFGLDYTQTSTKVKDKYPTVGSEKTALPNAWAYAQSIGLDSNTFRELRVFTAFFWEATWKWEAPTNVGKFLNTFNYIKVPPGSYLSNATCIIPRGGMNGASSFVYAGQGGDHGMVATEIKMDDAGWIGSGTERRLFDTPNSSGAGGNFAYNEAMSISNIRFIGPNKKGDGITRIGIFLSWMGECTYVNQVRSDYFQHGFVARGGVPLTIGTISAFWNEIGGFSALGSSLATINIQTLSGDGNGRLLNVAAGYGSPAGVLMNLGLLKSEDGTTPGAAISNQVAAYLEGQYMVNIGLVSFACQSGSAPEAMFVLNPTLPTFGNQASLLTVGAAFGFGYTTMIKNRVTGSTWANPGSYSAAQFSHYASQDSVFTGCNGLVKTGSGTGGGTTPPPPPPTGSAYPRTGWAATAYRSNSTTEQPIHAIDDASGRHWTNGVPQKADKTQWFRLDMGKAQKIAKVTLSTRSDRTTDYPLGLFVETSNDGTTWTGTPVSLSGTSNMTVTFTGQPTARYIRMAPNAASQHWWSIDQLNVFGS